MTIGKLCAFWLRLQGDIADESPDLESPVLPPAKKPRVQELPVIPADIVAQIRANQKVIESLQKLACSEKNGGWWFEDVMGTLFFCCWCVL